MVVNIHGISLFIGFFEIQDKKSPLKPSCLATILVTSIITLQQTCHFMLEVANLIQSPAQGGITICNLQIDILAPRRGKHQTSISQPVSE